jgi:hypothetical protein
MITVFGMGTLLGALAGILASYVAMRVRALTRKEWRDEQDGYYLSRRGLFRESDGVLIAPPDHIPGTSPTAHINGHQASE